MQEPGHRRQEVQGTDRREAALENLDGGLLKVPVTILLLLVARVHHLQPDTEHDVDHVPAKDARHALVPRLRLPYRRRRVHLPAHQMHRRKQLLNMWRHCTVRTAAAGRVGAQGQVGGTLAGDASFFLVSAVLHEPGGEAEEVRERRRGQAADVKPGACLLADGRHQRIERSAQQVRCVHLHAARTGPPCCGNARPRVQQSPRWRPADRCMGCE